MELKNNTLERYNTVVKYGFGISIVLMGFITMIGFLTFGSGVDGFILNNYASQDKLMGLSKIAVAVSLVFSYPLAFTGCRDGLCDMLQLSADQRSPTTLNVVTVGILALTTLLACLLHDVSYVIGFAGATLGTALTFVYPALMYRSVVAQQHRHEERGGVTFAVAIAVLGIAMGAIGLKNL